MSGIIKLSAFEQVSNFLYEPDFIYRGIKSYFGLADCQVVGSNHIAHIGHVKRGRFSSHGGRVEVKINPETRIKTMQAHSCTHLLNAVLHEVLPLTCQKSSLVSAGQFKFDFAVFKQVTCTIEFSLKIFFLFCD